MFKVALSLLALAVCASAHPAELGPPRLTDKRIVGGTNANRGEFPSQVSIRVGTSHICGGTLLAANAALTAAHCCDYSASRYSVVAGEHSLSANDGTEVTSSVSRVITHSSYNPNTLVNDICILVLSTPISQVAGSIQYVNLPTAGREPADLETLTVTGWGTTSEGGSLSAILKKANVPYVPNSRCSGYYQGFNTITSGMLCAGYESSGGVDACQGDSGGPIYFGDGTQVGVTSWGYGCARPRYPGVYTRVPSYISWINTNRP